MIRVAPHLSLARANKQVLVQSLVYGNDRVQGFVLNVRQSGCLASSFVGGRGDGEQGLTDKLHDVIRQYRVTGEHRADVKVAWHVPGGYHGNDLGRLADGIQIHGDYPGMGLLAVPDSGMQSAFRHG